MIARLGRRPWTSACSILLALASATAAVATAGDDQIRVWIGNLDAGSFATRESAMQHLLAAGSDAAPLLEQAQTGGSAEMQWRAAAILAQLKSELRANEASPATASVLDACSDEAPAKATQPPPSPAPPPEADIAEALAPPPSPKPLEAITEQVLIADAYVSPELSPEPAKSVTPAVAAPRASSPNVVLAGAPRQPDRSSSPVVFIRQPANRGPAAYNREGQPRLLNFLQRARWLFGLPAR